MIKYCTIADVRNFTKAQSAEYSDSAITLMIEQAQAVIDDRTVMAFNTGGNSVTEYYDGSGSDVMFTRNYPILTLTEVAVDEDNDESWDKILSPAEYEIDSDYGRICLTTQSTISKFPAYRRGVKLTYIYGFSAVPEIIKHISILLVANMIQYEAGRNAQIDDLIKDLTKARIELA